MREFVLKGENYCARVLREYSLTDFAAHLVPTVDVSLLRKLTVGDTVELSGWNYRALWMRQESDDRGSYLATGLRMTTVEESLNG